MTDNIYTIDLLAAGAGNVLIDDLDGIDWLEFSAAYVPGNSFPTSILLAWTSLNGVATDAIGGFYTGVNTGHNLVIHGLVENVRASNYADFVQGNELGNIIFGDRAAGGLGGDDTLWGGDGNDTIYGGAGADTITGDNGNDNIRGDAGDDTIAGGGGRDTIQGGQGADSMSGGGSARDTISYSSSTAGVTVKITFGTTTIGIGGDAQGDQINGFYDVIGSAQNDVITDTYKSTLTSGFNDNYFYGGAGDDKLFLGGGADRGFGGVGNDSILGEAGNDILRGDAGNDLLTGGIGADALAGGTGTDAFIFTTVIDSTVLAAGRDTITDFNHAEGDRVYLNVIDADPSLALNQAFHWRGALGFDGLHGALRAVNSGANTLVQADLDGDKLADFSILVLGVNNMVVGDFAL